MALKKMLGISPVGILLLAGTGGAAYGSLNGGSFADQTEIVYEGIEPYGQDTNGDGVATTVEGSFDIDGDGRFGLAEQTHFGISHYINWAYPEDFDLSSLAVEARVCNSACLSRPDGAGFACYGGQPSSVNCVAIGSICYSTGCAHPCVCPKP